MLELLKYVMYWFLSGVFCTIIILLYSNFIEKKEIEITLSIILRFLIISLIGGPLLSLIWFMPIWYMLETIYNINKSKVIWRNKRARSKNVLFGNNPNE